MSKHSTVIISAANTAAHTAKSILRIGPFTNESECALKLQTAIVDHHTKQQIQDEPQHQQHYHQQDLNQHQLLISNKYFSAIVVLQDLQAPATYSSCSYTNKNSWTEDGVILVFDEFLSNCIQTRTSSSSFNAVASAFEEITMAAQSNDVTQPGDMLRLCVGVCCLPTSTTIQQQQENQTTSLKEYEAEYSRRVLWCLDHGFEYVLADLSPDAVQRGHDERDKEGFARIIEAIQGTMWSSAVMKKNNKKHPPEAVHAVTVESTSAAASPAVASVRTTETETTPVSTTKHTENDTGVLLPPSLDPADNEALDNAIQEARRIREISQAVDLSDDERRKRAGDAARLVLSMMNEIGIDDEVDDED